MCTALIGITTFTYLATWSAIIYYMVHRDIQHYRHVIIPTLLAVANTTLVNVHIHSTCHVGYVKTGAATIAVLLLILLLNVSDLYSARCDPTRGSAGDTRSARTARADQQEA